MSRRQGQPLRFCVYCGAAIGSHLVACDDHSDLPPLDPNYQMRQDRPMLKAVK